MQRREWPLEGQILSPQRTPPPLYQKSSHLHEGQRSYVKPSTSHQKAGMSGLHGDRVSLGDPVATPKTEAGKGAVLSSGSSYNSIPPVTRAGGNVQNVRWRPSVFDFKSERGGGSICPTCKGVGRIPKGELGGCGTALIKANVCRSRR